MEHFELYSTIIFADPEGSKIKTMKMDIQIYEEQIETMRAEIEAWGETY